MRAPEPYYHVYIAFKNSKAPSTFLMNISEETVRKSIAFPFMKNSPILIRGKFSPPLDIEAIEIFMSQEPCERLILPDGRSSLEAPPEYVYDCFCRGKMTGFITLCTYNFITSPPQGRKETPFIELMGAASFLGLDTNWAMATCALQIQEVAVTLLAEHKGIKLDRTNVERILNRQIEELSFNHRYDAFCKEAESLFKIEMPILTGQLREMRTNVLHKGYNPQPEETEPIVSFTIGLLQKLKSISEAT